MNETKKDGECQIGLFENETRLSRIEITFGEFAREETNAMAFALKQAEHELTSLKMRESQRIVGNLSIFLSVGTKDFE